MRTSAHFGAKIFGFLEIYGVSARTKAVSQCGQREGVVLFVILCGRLLFGRPLIFIILIHLIYSCLDLMYFSIRKFKISLTIIDLLLFVFILIKLKIIIIMSGMNCSKMI